jgi:4-amino-4-deoxy-L-arabinose transferase-like glycosyltransferase
MNRASPGSAALALITVLGLALRLHGLWTAELSYDEGATWYFAGLPFAELWGPATRLETNPPLFYSIADIARSLGATAEDERLLSVVAGTACIPLSFWLAERIGGRFAGVGAALLFAVSASMIGMSQDARSYGMLTVAALAALLAVQRWVASGGWAPLGAYVAAALSALYLHDTAVLLVAACNGIFILVWLDQRRRLPDPAWRWVLANAVVLLGWLPWAMRVLDQTQHELAHFWLVRPTLGDFRYELLNTFAIRFLSVAEPAADLFAVALLTWGIAATRRSPFARSLALCAVVGVPLASFLVSQWRPILNGKTLLWLVPVGLCFVALGCAALSRLRGAVLAAVLLFHAVATAEYFRTRPAEGAMQAATGLMHSARAGDALVVAPRFLAFMLDYHGLPVGSLPRFSIGDAAPWFPTIAAPQLAPDGALAALRGFSRVWLAERGQPAVARLLGERLDCAFMRAAGPAQVGAIRLQRFDRRADPTCR